MKIYFCGSIRGGRADAELYKNIIEFLQSHGTVLTEHVGKGEPKTLAEVELTEGVERDQFIFKQDMGWLSQADVVVAEVTQTSSGVGFELGVAWKRNLPVMVLFRPSSGNHVSAMIRGTPDFQYAEYEHLPELLPVLEGFLKKHKKDT